MRMQIGMLLVLLGCLAVLLGFWFRDWFYKSQLRRYAGYVEAPLVGTINPSFEEMVEGIKSQEYLIARRYLQCDMKLVEMGMLDLPHLNIREAFSAFRERRLEGVAWKEEENFLNQCIEVLSSRSDLDGCMPKLRDELHELYLDARQWVNVVNYFSRNYHVVSNLART